ncbi:MAG: RsbRD N-terminal domain-containing protein [Deltaproteobacteria bacterium]|nr:RsbRD N-terminal domain-containing protein [Deltaproteobacteria bacterium]
MLRDLILEKKKDIVKRWIELTIDTYPPEGGSFMKNQKNQFANPVGAAILNGAETLYKWIMSGDKDLSPDVVRRLDDVIRIRAVQQFSASDAVGFIFLLKRVIRETLLRDALKDKNDLQELFDIDSRIDSLALHAFNMYMKCREKLFEIRAMEIRNRTSRILERACMKYGAPHEW